MKKKINRLTLSYTEMQAFTLWACIVSDDHILLKYFVPCYFEMTSLVVQVIKSPRQQSLSPTDRKSQMFSIDERSSDRAWQSLICNCASSKYLLVALAICGLALSYWKILYHDCNHLLSSCLGRTQEVIFVQDLWRPKPCHQLIRLCSVFQPTANLTFILDTVISSYGLDLPTQNPDLSLKTFSFHSRHHVS